MVFKLKSEQNKRNRACGGYADVILRTGVGGSPKVIAQGDSSGINT